MFKNRITVAGTLAVAAASIASGFWPGGHCFIGLYRTRADRRYERAHRAKPTHAGVPGRPAVPDLASQTGPPQRHLSQYGAGRSDARNLRSLRGRPAPSTRYRRRNVLSRSFDFASLGLRFERVSAVSPRGRSPLCGWIRLDESSRASPGRVVAAAYAG